MTPTESKRAWYAVSALVVVFAVSVTLLLLNVYGTGIDTEIAGLRIRATSVFRPAGVALLSFLLLCRYRPSFRPNRDAWTVIACLVAYILTYHPSSSGDVTPTVYTSLSIAAGRGTSLDDYPELVERGVPYFLYRSLQGLRSSYPLGPALLAWPLFLPASMSSVPRPVLVDRLGTLSAILLGGASVWLALQVAKRLDPPFSPHVLALAYGLGTSHWSTSASALWQHGPGELWILGALERLTDRDTPPPRRLLALGTCLAMAVFTRPSLAIPGALVFGLALHRFRKRVFYSVAGVSAIAIPLLAYHLEIYGSVLGPYVSQRGGLGLRPLADWLGTVFLLLSSPSRGILWYEPVVALTLGVAIAQFVRRRGGLDLASGLLGFALTLAIYGSWTLWWGGYSFGPRLMTDALPFWFLAVASTGPVGPWLARASAPLIAVGALVNCVAGVGHPVMWDIRPPVDWFPERLESVGDSQLLTGVLATLCGNSLTRRAVEADENEQYEAARELWAREWKQHPWHLFAAHRVADLLLRTDRFAEAEKQVGAMLERWPDSAYVRLLARRLPSIAERLQDPSWVPPARARAKPNPERAYNVADGKLATAWSTVNSQNAGDWLELVPEGEVALHGVAVFFAPEFGEGPATLKVTGRTPAGKEVELAVVRNKDIVAARKGWIAVRFPPQRLSSVRLSLRAPSVPPWTVTEARLLIGNEGGTAPGAGADEPRFEPSTPP